MQEVEEPASGTSDEDDELLPEWLAEASRHLATADKEVSNRPRLALVLPALIFFVLGAVFGGFTFLVPSVSAPTELTDAHQLRFQQHEEEAEGEAEASDLLQSVITSAIETHRELGAAHAAMRRCRAQLAETVVELSAAPPLATPRSCRREWRWEEGESERQDAALAETVLVQANTIRALEQRLQALELAQPRGSTADGRATPPPRRHHECEAAPSRCTGWQCRRAWLKSLRTGLQSSARHVSGKSAELHLAPHHLAGRLA